MLRQPPALHGIRRARWRLRDLRQVVPWLRRYTLPGLCRLLQRLRIRWKRGRLRVHSPDRAYATKLAWIARAHQQARAQPAQVRLCYGDEFSLYRQPTLSGTYAAVGTEPTAPLSDRANTRQRRSAALEVGSGQVVWTAGAKMGVPGLCQFLTALRRGVPHADAAAGLGQLAGASASHRVGTGGAGGDPVAVAADLCAVD